MLEFVGPLKGRGASSNPPNRFEQIRYDRSDIDGPPDETPGPKTEFFRDLTKSFITTNESPDVPFAASINPYRGCEHGCFYCYARPYHEYLGLSAGLDFETKIFVKEDGPAILRKELSSKKWQPQPLGLSGVTDPYQPIERTLGITRGCLEVLVEFRNPVTMITKNHLVCRDIDILSELARFDAVSVMIAVTTVDDDLAGLMEPRASRPHARLQAIRELAEAGVPVGVLAAPIIPGLTDHEIPAILKAAREAGAQAAGYTMLRLPHGVGDLVEAWLEQHYPERKPKILSRLREMRGGQRNDPRFGARMRGTGPMADAVRELFALTKKREGYGTFASLSTAHFRRPPEAGQAMLFEDWG